MIPNHTKIKLPRLVSDGMVIQRNTQVKIWGWAPAGEIIKVVFERNVYRSDVNADGEWSIVLPTGKAGGPYDMVIETAGGAEKITLKNILLGDVWLCSGQSNMEMKMLSIRDTYPEEITHAYNDSIRQFLVPVKYNFEEPQADFESGSWVAANPESVLNFTAAGYFFAAGLFERVHVPIGLINASLGGSPAEAWLSGDALPQFPDYLEAAERMKDRGYLESCLKENQMNMEEWHQRLNQNDVGMPAAGKPFFDSEYDAEDWQCINIPSYWEDEGAGDFNGAVWFRKEIEIPHPISGSSIRLFLGNVVDEDTVYVNGIRVGSTPIQYVSRKYDIPEGVLREGKNTIVVRVVNLSGKGGFYKGKPYQLHIGERIVDLCGEWQYRIGAKSDPIPEPTFVEWFPSGLYNGMIAPMTHYAIKGVIWYQGESNAQKPKDYERLFKALIADWREKWGQGNFPFLYVQLPNYAETFTRAVGNWAQIREAQRRTLDVPGTGMAVTIDIGEWNDVHPSNKKDVGSRLALAAQKVAYGELSVVASGPLFQSAKRDGNRIILSFSDKGSGLITRGGERPECFEIAGTDRRFVRADAEIEGDNVAVQQDQVPEPIYVRYAWTDNPEGANLYNREGLPASPFTTE